MKSAIASITAAALTLGTPVSAGPDDITKHLMTEPASLLDLGLVRLQQRLQESQKDGDKYHYSTNFFFETNTIGVFAARALVSETDRSREEAASLCDDKLVQLRLDGGVWPASGELGVGEYSRWSSLFTHIGYTTGSSEVGTESLKGLDKKFQISVIEYFMDGEDTKVLKCVGALLGTGFSEQVLDY
ncbi:hypothetical protein [Shimia isoporae]|nr:hypothetical protein [Shimia isoporae]